MLPADRWGDAVLVRAFGPRMVCMVCGIVGANAQPHERDLIAIKEMARGRCNL